MTYFNNNFSNNPDDSEDNSDKKSKYNAAVSQIYRLDNLFQNAQYHRSKGGLTRCNWVLDSIWVELASDAKPADEKVFNQFINHIIKFKNNKSSLYQIMIKKEIWLRKLQNNQGKGTAYIDESEDDFE